MDPEANLKEQRELAELIVAVANDPEDHPERENVTVDDTSLRLAELVLAFHYWPSPEQWRFLIPGMNQEDQ